MAKGKDKSLGGGGASSTKDPREAYLDRPENEYFKNLYERQKAYLESASEEDMKRAAEEMGVTLDEYKEQQRQSLDDLLRMAEEHAKQKDEEYKRSGSSYEEDKKWEAAKQAKTQANAEKRASKTYDPGWVDKYLSKKGNNLETLSKSIKRMSKEEIIKRFPGYGITLALSKNEMASIVINTLEHRGYRD